MKHVKTPGRAAHGRRCAASESPNTWTPEPERNRRPHAEDHGKPRCNRPPPIAGPRARRASPSDNQLYVVFQMSQLTRSLSFVFQLTRVKLERKGELCWNKRGNGIRRNWQLKRVKTIQINIECSGDTGVQRVMSTSSWCKRNLNVYLDLRHHDWGTPSRILAKWYSVEIGQCTETNTKTTDKTQTRFVFSEEKPNQSEVVCPDSLFENVESKSSPREK